MLCEIPCVAFYRHVAATCFAVWKVKPRISISGQQTVKARMCMDAVCHVLAEFCGLNDDAITGVTGWGGGRVARARQRARTTYETHPHLYPEENSRLARVIEECELKPVAEWGSR